ncbi:MAG: DUF2892 domain-containing protein [Chitinophagaceae bacterium]|jgi:hypothetical protein|nr:DUF2892 domain-containing protein [Chitinophagaceae bacterium]MBP6047313.1 DUF2892 domain-containing protein [Ferruginibacter sp.]MBK7087718.1 DUF2892 domain-containing protein [Chitinophagaceae bacterium]MBK7346483.1 DUF2892 domain-containing protein [Chitinophagaceae bacterium]MBK7735599.1 DUF2892 domain-containing protein [Chitinophagaceae bacterium]
MKKNMGAIDKTVRLVVAALIAVLYFTKIITGFLALVLAIFAIILTIGVFISFCPLYNLFGINTCTKTQKNDF